ncbi:MAG: alpha/beta fold hydrolase [Acidimicrobiales bacterium]
MTVVLVHGNPETADLWDPLVTALAERGVTDVVRVVPPGFGAPVPDGWTGHPNEYAMWLAGELEALAGGGPVDLVGHDWGAGHVAGAVALRPDLVGTWAIDCGGLLNPDYVWHDLAQVWQTDGAGEEAIATMAAVGTDDRSVAYQNNGIPPGIATAMAAAYDDTMGRCILALYRGAIPPALSNLADKLEVALDTAPVRPRGLLIDATADPYVPSGLVPAVAERFRLGTQPLPGAGHWWMVDPERLAEVSDRLVGFWAES